MLLLSVMSIIEAIILGIVEGVTEFLPVSSTAHLTIAEKLFGYSLQDPGLTAFTAIIQTGAIAATIVYFWPDIWKLGRAWLAGLGWSPARRQARGHDYRYGWAIIIGSVPIGVAGLVFQDQIEGAFRNLWLVSVALLVWSAVLWAADRTADGVARHRTEASVSWRDTLIIGLAQCLALVPGVSRSGATISAGLFRGFDRVTVTRLSFFLSIPALLAAGLFQAVSEWNNIGQGVGWPATVVGTVVSFVVAYWVIAWLLGYVAKHSFSLFIVYRVILGIGLVLLLWAGVLAAS